MFTNKIGYWLNERGLKQKKLAKQCGVSEQTFSSWVNNKTQPDLLQAAVLAEILGLRTDDLYERVKKKEINE